MPLLAVLRAALASRTAEWPRTVTLTAASPRATCSLRSPVPLAVRLAEKFVDGRVAVSRRTLQAVARLYHVGLDFAFIP